MSYQDRIEQQIEQYKQIENIHDLPEIFHVWSNKHLRPRLNSVAQADSVVEFYSNAFYNARRQSGRKVRFGSLGSGDCSLEIEIATHLRHRGLKNFIFDCFELSPHLLARAKDKAAATSLGDTINFIECDLNAWVAKQASYTGLMAHHALHHFTGLEQIFEASHAALAPGGVFATNDMIGRNGHMRWPECLEWVRRIWAFLPDPLKYNQQLKTHFAEFENFDCSTEGFEGIRAQDILPLLLKRFHAHTFLGYGGLIEVFIDRGYGHNFDPKDPKDVAMIDFISDLNDLLIDSGVIKPTMVYGVFGREKPTTPRHFRHWTANFCLRDPSQ